jgi:Histidine kinase-, DNA gyrase B-, and HSP90-like ATPase
MTTELKIHPSFFREFATKTWVSPLEIIKELVENAFDEDATSVLVTILKDGSVAIEDNAGMDEGSMEKFLLLGSPHKKQESISPVLKRIRTGRYGTGRLSFLTSFDRMKLRTKRDNFVKSIQIDSTSLDRLFVGNAKLEELTGQTLRRNGTELVLMEPKIKTDPYRLSKEIRKLAILRQPMFEVSIKEAEAFQEWDFNGAQLIKPAEIQGHRIPVHLNDGNILGEIIIAKRPLADDERGIAVMVGNHIVIRSTFGFDTKLNRVTGNVRCDSLTSRFADKSALIEDEEYIKFNETMKSFIIDSVIPALTEYEDVLITREESRIYRQIDKALGQAVVENIETSDQIDSYEMIPFNRAEKMHQSSEVINESMQMTENLNPSMDGVISRDIAERSMPADVATNENHLVHKTIPFERVSTEKTIDDLGAENQNSVRRYDESPPLQTVSTYELGGSGVQGIEESPKVLKVIEKKEAGSSKLGAARRPLKRTFALRKVGYKVIPYEDDSDTRYSFTTENIVFVNKANSTYRAEAFRGDEFLMRHIISIVAEAIAKSKHPEGKDALELQNRLVAEAIRIHDDFVVKR